MTDRDERPESPRTREKMLDTALMLMGERGYEGTSLQMVADAIGVTKAAVYYHFHTKADLLEAILQRLFADTPPIPTSAEIRSKRSRLKWFAEQLLELLVRERNAMSALNSDPMIRKHATFIKLVEGARQEALLRLYGDSPSDEQRASFYLATCVLHTLPSLTDLSNEDLVRAVRPTLYRTLHLPPPTRDDIASQPSAAWVADGLVAEPELSAVRR